MKKSSYFYLGAFNLLIVIYCSFFSPGTNSISYHLGQIGGLLCFFYLGLHLVAKLKAWGQRKNYFKKVE